MAGATSQFTLSTAVEIARQNQHGDIDPAVTTFLEQTIDALWQRVKAQPSTYLFTKEEFAVFTYYRDRFRGKPTAQQAVRRFWEHQDSSQTAGAKSAAVYFPSEGDSIFSQEDFVKGHFRQLSLANSISIAPEKTVSKNSIHPCQKCSTRRIKCDRKQPVCTACERLDWAVECTYNEPEQLKRAAGPNHNTDESNTFHLKTRRSTVPSNPKVNADQFNKNEDGKTMIKDLEVKMPKNNLKRRFQIGDEWYTVERLEQQMSPIREGDEGHVKTANTSRMHVMSGEEYNIINSTKLYVEYLTGEAWDWWPLRPSFRQLLDDEIRIQWQCTLGHRHWTVLSKTGIVPPQKIVKREAATQSTSSQRKKPSSSSENNSSPSTDRSSGSASSIGSSASDASESHSFTPSHDDPDSGREVSKPSTNTAVNIVPPSKLNGFVLFGVQGSKRLQSARLRLAQIDIEVHNDDDSFFDEMIIQYNKLRGSLRRILSIWVFHTCDFVMFYKANPNEIMPGPEELPPLSNQDYKYLASRNPPILRTVFNANFYGCKKACILSQLDLLCLFHECTGRNHCGKYRILKRLPKRLRPWEIDRDDENEEAWGLNVAFGVSFFRVAVYHLLILAAPTTFWGLWLRSWPRDWQNASVPFFAVVVLLSLFWLPFSQNRSSAEKKGGSMKKAV